VAVLSRDQRYRRPALCADCTQEGPSPWSEALTSRMQRAVAALLWYFVDSVPCILFGECKERSFAPTMVCSPLNSRLAKAQSTGDGPGSQYICALYPASTPASLEDRPHSVDNDITTTASSSQIGRRGEATAVYIAFKVQRGSCVISRCSLPFVYIVKNIRCIF